MLKSMPLSNKTIYIDLDDVLCQTARRFLVIVEREFGKKVTYEQLTNFDVGTACGLRSEERELLYRIVHQPDELMQMAPIVEAIAAVTQWADADYEIAIVTGRPPASFDASRAWLARHGVPHHSFTMVDKYARFETANTPAIGLQELAGRKYSWAVEDSLPMAQYLASQMAVPVALVDCPWNRSAQEHANISRHTDWATIAQSMPLVANGQFAR
jgi:uncharacterized HAD superfamily protein